MRVVVLVIVGLFGLRSGVGATEYYVSLGGNDVNNGGSGAPFRTFKKANSVLVGGDVLYVTAGVYNESLIIDRSGTSGKTIKVRALNTDKPVIDVRANSGSSIWIRGNYIDLTGFKATNSTSMGVRINGSNVVVDNVEVYNIPDHGIFTTGKYVTVRNSVVHDSMTANEPTWDVVKNKWVYPLSGGWGSGFKVERGAENVVFENNVSYHNYGEGIATTMGKNIIFRNNYSHDNYSVNIYVDHSDTVLVERNMVTCSPNDTKYFRDGHPAAGVLMGEEDYSGWTAPLANVTIVNNISYGCRGFNFYGAEVASGGLRKALIANNTIWNTFGGSYAINIANEPANNNIRIVNNIVDGRINAGSGSVVTNNINQAQFVGAPSASPGSFKLAAGSSAINKGVVISEVVYDFGGSIRDNLPDIGAWEYGSVGGPSIIPTSVIPTTVVTVTTTPSQKLLGDANSDGRVDLVDFTIWKSEYLRTLSTKRADFNKSGGVDLVDFSIWKKAYLLN